MKSPKRRILVGVVLVGATLALGVTWLNAHAAVAAILGSAALTVLGIPQIIKNFRHGEKATKDLAIESYLIWFGAASFFTAASILNDSSIWWIAANIAGLVESLLIILQINLTRAVAKPWRISLLAIGTVLAPMPLVFFSDMLPVAGWAAFVFTAGMGLLLFLNVPQIRRNYLLWQSERLAPEGLAWMSLALILTGNALHLIPAYLGGDFFWLLTSVSAIFMTGVILLQLIRPGLVNRRFASVTSIVDKIRNPGRFIALPGGDTEI